MNVKNRNRVSHQGIHSSSNYTPAGFEQEIAEHAMSYELIQFLYGLNRKKVEIEICEYPLSCEGWDYLEEINRPDWSWDDSVIRLNKGVVDERNT